MELVPVEIESPYSGDVERNLDYVRDAMYDCLTRGEAPIASHALYTQPGVLDDEFPEERELGMEAGKAWTPFVERVVVYVDLGISGGMIWGIKRALELGKKVEFRILREWKEMRCLHGHLYLDEVLASQQEELEAQGITTSRCLACGIQRHTTPMSTKPGTTKRHF